MTANGRWLSKPAVLWALHEAPDVPSRLVSTLIAVAAYAGADGRGAYPSAATIAAITRKSETQAKRDLAELEKRGLLAPGDGRIVKDIRADRRPNVYDLAMPRGASGRTPQGRPRGASGDSTGCIPLHNGVRPDAPEEFLKNSRTARGRESADALRADALRAGAQPETPPPCTVCGPGPYPPCPYCGREVEWHLDLAEFGAPEEIGLAEWRDLLRRGLKGLLACSRGECQDASDYCIRCHAELDEHSLFMCRDCRVREVVP